MFVTTGLAQADVFQLGGDYLVRNQNADGGWDWPVGDEYPAWSNAPNILAATAMGLVQAYEQIGDPNYRTALERAGTYLLGKAAASVRPEDAYLAVALDRIFGVTVHAEYVRANFYEALAAGTYDYFGDGSLLVDTNEYIALVRAARDEQELANLATVDLGMGLYAAGLIGADTTAWIAGTKAEINELDGTQVFDVLGLAAGVLGLAAVGEDIDPVAGAHAAAGNLVDLADVLAGYQLASGGVTWNSLVREEAAGNEQVQETAFAVLVLQRIDAQRYAENVAQARLYLEQVQGPSGGWENYAGDGENNEVTGEALWSLGESASVRSQAEGQAGPGDRSDEHLGCWSDPAATEW